MLAADGGASSTYLVPSQMSTMQPSVPAPTPQKAGKMSVSTLQPTFSALPQSGASSTMPKHQPQPVRTPSQRSSASAMPAIMPMMQPIPQPQMAMIAPAFDMAPYPQVGSEV